MATNYQQRGESITWTNGTGSAVVSGQVVAVGNMIGIALVDIANAATGSVAIEGVFSGIPKVTAAVFAQGEKLIWDSSAAKFDDSAATPATGDITGGATAYAAGTSSDTTCTIKLTPGNTTVT
jgi:predicted RecA/RadA family phage recombinase